MEEITYEEALDELGFIFAVFIDNVGISTTKKIVIKSLNKIIGSKSLSKDSCRQSDVAGLRGI